MKRLIITCDEPPRPPLNGNNRKTFELIWAIRHEWEIHLLAYPADDADWQRLQQTWEGGGVTCHRLARRHQGRHWRMLTRSESLPTVTRDFEAETTLVRALVRERPESRLLVDFISGSPLLARIGGSGTVLSGHDCMSYLFGEEAKFAKSFDRRWHHLIRRHFARATEKRYAHLAGFVHLVSKQDARELTKVNPQVRPVVIPLGGGEADEGSLLPADQRTGGLIWGSLKSELILSGVRQVFAAAREHHPDALRGWILLGRVSERTARQLLPEMDALGIVYLPRVEQISGLLGRVRTVLLPDTGGTGQKNRALDGLAHGCVVCGLPEVFRDFGSTEEAAHLTGRDYAELIGLAAQVNAGQFAEVGPAARRLFTVRFSRAALARAWSELLQAAGPLSGG